MDAPDPNSSPTITDFHGFWPAQLADVFHLNSKAKSIQTNDDNLQESPACQWCCDARQILRQNPSSQKIKERISTSIIAQRARLPMASWPSACVLLA